MARYIILIRSAYDPDRRPRPAGGQEDRAPHRTLAKTRPEDWKPRILELLAREGPLTFNAACVLLVDKTADIAAETPLEAAFWELVAEGELEISMEAPVLFRRVLEPRA